MLLIIKEWLSAVKIAWDAYKVGAPVVKEFHLRDAAEHSDIHQNSRKFLRFIGWIKPPQAKPSLLSFDTRVKCYEEIRRRLLMATRVHVVLGDVPDFDQRWILELAITLIWTRSAGKRIVIHFPAGMKGNLRTRFQLLAGLGCEFAEYLSSTPREFSCLVFFDPFEYLREHLMVIPKSTSLVRGVCYYPPNNQAVIAQMAAAFGIQPQSSLTSAQKPTFAPMEAREIEAFVRKSRKYKVDDNIAIKLTKVEVAVVRPISPWVYTHKINQVKETLLPIFDDLNKSMGFEAFRPMYVELSNKARNPIIPPVVEKHGNMYVIAEGHNRFYAARQLGLKFVHAIVVENLREAPASHPLYWGDVTESNDDRSIADDPGRMEHARCIELDSRSNLWTDIEIPLNSPNSDNHAPRGM